MWRNRVTLIGIVTSIITIILAIVTILIAHGKYSWSSLSPIIILSLIVIGLGTFLILDISRETRKREIQEQPLPIKIILEIGKNPVTIETADTEHTKEMLKLIQDLQRDQSSLIRVKNAPEII